jgi:hypothetical protein
VTKLA